MGRQMINLIWHMRLWKDTSGQDMLEYACYVAAVALMYAAVSPSVATSISTVFSKIAVNVAAAANTGG
jgi:Flp pilus assembly pilin Flp